MKAEAEPMEPGPGSGARRVRGLCELGRTEAALEAARAPSAADPEDAEALELVGLCLIRLGRAAEARAPLAAALARAPERPHVHYLSGFAARLAGDETGAEQGLAEALRLDPIEPVYLRALSEWRVE